YWAMPGPNLPAKSNRAEIAAFLDKVKALPVAGGPAPARRGRLIYAMDATASREPMWDRAAKMQADMFLAARDLGGLDVQLVHYGGIADFEVGPWVSDSAALVARMQSVRCKAGETQIANILRHAIAETKRAKVAAVVFVGDAVEESPDALAGFAGQLGVLGTPVFAFHEGGEATARRALEAVARLSGGAYCPFDAHSADALRDLLSAAAAYAAGGRKALGDFSKRKGGAVALLAGQVK
ncbi:MAG: VWA domain-containing protein, partial [Tagaea sp.]